MKKSKKTFKEICYPVYVGTVKIVKELSGLVVMFSFMFFFLMSIITTALVFSLTIERMKHDLIIIFRLVKLLNFYVWFMLIGVISFFLHSWAKELDKKNKVR